MKINRSIDFFRIVICLFFIAPYFYQFYYLFYKTDSALVISELWPELRWGFFNSFKQAVFSAILSLLSAIIFTFAFFCLHKEKLKKIFIFTLLIPSLLPSLFIILGLMPLFDWVGRGIVSIVIAHTFVFSGFAALQIIAAISTKCGDFVESSYVAGVSKVRFFFSVICPLIKSDLLFAGVLILISTFGSFSIPLVLGHTRDTSLEILIYEKFKINYNLSAAFALSVVQSLFLLAVQFLVVRKSSTLSKKIAPFNLLSSNLALGFFVFIHTAFLVTYFVQVFKTLYFSHLIPEALLIAKSSLWYTLQLALVMAVTSFIVLQIYIFIFKQSFIFKFFETFVLPSSTLIGLSVLFFFRENSSFTKLILALVLLLLPWMIKMIIHPKLLSLTTQEEISYIAGADTWNIYRHLRFPQLKNEIVWSISLIVIWAISDFTVTRLVLEKQETFGLVLFSLMNSYRLNQAVFLSLILIGSSILAYLAVRWGVHAFYKIFEKKI